ncbi:ArnT family glycosyltransferase [Polynucleobacter sphagniphilus]|jgi:4-amino-4-deoxy-L-arabinose transferase-like glycosyltransferase|uniref:4-amino-4-deoxy-L-arabinose transferase-like glycosyltransferase n=1 Tax=Polynucleobacter sphagniphilus TaxID=1743169 RepID=A0AA43S4F1_9BURK|nr:glycosyltransferase family 39 protein [Polynucleobacter sphagniphilus]MDF9787432.1 4-amino-4-deoxy-L-arabinose transferase-like glycosyltransferase [Polynucleobacter sphagniphilus]MDH6154193.1 4-amino-4-deoxy-L-arabinose transferase-like glycosyltransferase [Polynucleobacter sphagniphilus]MDH6240467.1 4-amino-4-deoxy-L-arabinose transferase-like glycosyltransferase [Polynucleobacter sphagniphilus]MDH6420752.1 4-amino-4-deoxy-L-arabinose transferase-like glycosyltransferase [Polynucleobacter 
MQFGQIRQSSALNPGKILLLVLLYSLLWFGTLNYRHLIPSDEGRYAEMAREMLVTGDWITPRYNGYKYFEKPPLQIWATAAAFQAFGIGDWQARLWTALTGFLTILCIGFTGARIYNARAGWLGALVLASSPMWVIAGHFNSLDMGLSAFLVAALCSLLFAQSSENKTLSRNWMWACWACMALATLSKGVIGIAIPAMVFVVYSISAWDWKIWKRLYLISGIALYLAITAPWFALVARRNPEFLEFFFIHEHLQRFTQDDHSRTGPIYYFIPLLLIGFLPWIAQIPSSIAQAWRERRGYFSPSWLLVCWFLVILGFFSISHSKLPGYIIPIFPALAMLVGNCLDRNLGLINSLSKSWQLQTLGFAMLGFVGFFFLSAIGQQARPDEIEAYTQYTHWVIAALIALIGFNLFAFVQSKRKGLASITSFASGFFLCAIIAGTGHEVLGRAVSGIDLANQVKASIPKNANIYSVRILDHTVPFYLGRTMVMVEFPDELEFGVNQEPDLWIPSLDAFKVRWNEDQSAYALMVPEQYLELQKTGLPMQELGRDSRRVIVKHPDAVSFSQ